MQRILAKILDIKELSSRKVRKLTVSEYLLKIKMKEAACKGYVLPPRVKGRVWLIIRKYLFLRKPKVGDEIVLSPQEVQGFLNPLRIEPSILNPEPDGVRFRLLLHNPAGKSFDYKVVLPSSKKEIQGSITDSEEIALPIPKEISDGCHPIQAVCGRWSTKAILPFVKPGCVYSYTADVNRDGFKERILENDFLRLALAPHIGARVESIWLKSSPPDILGRTFEYDKDGYVEYGGCDEHIGDFPGDLWKAKFKEKEQSNSSVTLSHSWKGFQMEKRIGLLPSLPLVHHVLKINWKGKGEKDILYWHRMAMALDNPSWASVVNIQTHEKLEKIRYAHPTSWWRERKDYYGLKLGAIVYSNENRREILGLMTDRDSLEFVGCTSMKGFYLLNSYFRRKKLKSKEGLEFHYIYILGEDFNLDSEACFILCTTPWRNGRRHMAVIGKTEQRLKELRGKLSTNESITLYPKRFDGVGRVLIGQKEIYSKGKVKVKFRIAEKEYSLRVKEA